MFLDKALGEGDGDGDTNGRRSSREDIYFGNSTIVVPERTVTPSSCRLQMSAWQQASLDLSGNMKGRQLHLTTTHSLPSREV